MGPHFPVPENRWIGFGHFCGLTIAMKCRYGIDTRIPPFEPAKLKDLVITIDPKAFLIINETQEGIGKSFDSPGGFAVNKV
jgi:hypothetical protein